MSEQIAKFRLSKFTITKSVIEIKDAEKISDNLNAEFNQSGATEENKNVFKYTLDATIKDSTENLLIKVVCLPVSLFVFYSIQISCFHRIFYHHILKTPFFLGVYAVNIL